jgi:hypothetical protein
VAGRILSLSLLALLEVAATLWGVLALHYSDVRSDALRMGLAAAFAVCGISTLVATTRPRVRWRAVAAFAVVLALVVAWWSRIPPSNDRDWAPEYARLTTASVEGDRVRVHNVRNFDYHTESRFTPRWEDRTYDLDRLDSVDLVASYWMGEAIAHVMLSFGFGGEDFLAVSIETRRERSEGYSTIAGFFKQYELYYVVADERDVIRLRTNYRHDPPEDVYVYRTDGRSREIRRVFLDYLREINSLAERPQWYNTLTTNCTTAILTHLRVNPGAAPMSWKVLLSGYAPRYAWERGALESRLPFAELKRRSRVNDVARAADRSPDFSQRIRVDLPGWAWRERDRRGALLDH